MQRKLFILWLAGIFLATECSAQFHIAHKDKQLQNSAAVGSGAVLSITPSPTPPTPAAHRTEKLVATHAPTITDIQPRAQIAGGKVVLTGTNFDDHTTVTFGGVAAKSVTVSDDGKTLTAVIDKSGGSAVVVTNGSGSAAAPGNPAFTFIPLAPTITSVLPANSAAGSKVVIKGTNFINENLSVSFKGTAGINPIPLSSTEIWVQVPAGVTGDTVNVSTNGGVAVYPAKANALDANADLTVPNLGQGITIIPTPTFTYTSVHAHNCFTFSSSIWANSFATDSNRQAVGSKLLLVQTSLFGFKVAGNLRFTNAQSDLDVSLYGEENILVKKVGYYDMNAKTNTNFNPLVLQTRVGPTVSLFNSIFLGVYENILSVESENANVSTFFQTGSKNVFAYPEIDAAGIFPLSKGSSQQIKAEIDLIVNNKDANYFYTSANSVIPYFKLGFVTGL
jgi:hypothetical protein